MEAAVRHRKNKKKRKAIEPTEVQLREEAELEHQLFGGPLQKLESSIHRINEDENMEEEEITTTTRKPAWVDEDDENIRVDLSAHARTRKLRKHLNEKAVTGPEYEQRLRQQFMKLAKNVDWAALPEDAAGTGEAEDEEEEEPMEDVTRTTQKLTQETDRLTPHTIDIIRMRDANIAEYSKAVVQSVQFHPRGQLLITAGYDKTLRFFQVDGKKNTKVQSVFFDDLPIRSAFFTADGSQVVCSGRRKYFYVYDIVSGKVNRVPGVLGRTEKSLEVALPSPDSQHIVFFGRDGNAIFVSNKSKQFEFTLKMNGTLRSAAFTADGRRFYTAGGDGQIFEWDVGMRRCSRRFVDEGAVCCTALAVSPDAKFIASGSDSGVVNLYEMDRLDSFTPKPYKSIMNLTTEISALKFNCDGQILAAASQRKKDAFKLIHLPSATVFANWPTSRTPLRYVESFDFSPSSAFLSIGNDKGKVLLYRLGHYDFA